MMHMQKKISSLYKQVWMYFAENSKFCLIILLIIIEFIIYAILNAQPTSERYMQYANEAEAQYNSLFALIFFENTKTSLKIILFGVVPLLIGSSFAAFATVYPMAEVMKFLLQDIEIGIILRGTVPHGTLELPAFILSIMISFLISKEITGALYDLICSKGTYHRRISNIGTLLVGWALIVVPMLMIAAVIESYLTPLLL